MRQLTAEFDMSSPEIIHLCAADPRLAAVIKTLGPVRCEPVCDPFAFVVQTIVGQMLSARVADVIAARLDSICSGSVTPGAILTLSAEALTAVGLSRAKAAAVRALAETVTRDPVFFDRLETLTDDAVQKELTHLRGIGSWTAKMYLLFVLQRPDVLPFEDGALQQAFRWLYDTDDAGRAAIEAQACAWKPYASLASRYLYRALDSGLLSQPFEHSLK